MERLFKPSLTELEENATYTSKMAVVEFVNALGIWVEESLLKRRHKTSFFSIMADMQLMLLPYRN